MNTINTLTKNEQIDLPLFQQEGLDMKDLPASNQPSFKDETNEFLSKFHESSLIQNTFDKIANCHKSAGSSMVESMLLTGKSGNGKTTICQKYAEQYPSYLEGSKRIMPVIYITLPVNATLTDLSVAILEQLTSKLNFKGSSSVLRKKALNMLKIVSPKLIIIDEAQRLNHQNLWYKPQDALEFIATCQDILKTSFVLCGTPDLTQLTKTTIEDNSTGTFEPFIMRTRQSISIPAMKYSSKTWKTFITGIIDNFPRRFETKKDELNKRVFIATQGRIGFVLKLFKEILEETDENTLITLKALSVAFARITSTSICGFNPFVLKPEGVNGHIKDIILVKEVK